MLKAGGSPGPSASPLVLSLSYNSVYDIMYRLPAMFFSLLSCQSRGGGGGL